MTISIKVLSFMLLSTLLVSSCKDDKDNEQPLPNNPVDTTLLPSEKVVDIYIDDSNIVWIGTSAGLVCYNGNTWKTYKESDGIPADSIAGLAHQISKHGNEIWTATPNGASVSAYDIDGITAATVYRKDNSGLYTNKVSSIAIDKDNVRWFGTEFAVSVFAGHEWFNKLFRHKQISCISTASSGWSYFGTLGDGVARYKLDSNDVDGITSASMIDTDWSDLPNDNVYSIFIDKDDNQWYGTKNGAAFHVGTDTRRGWTVYTTNDGLSSNKVFSVFQDSKGAVWFGTDNGISIKDGNDWKQFTVSNGISSDTINAITEDKNGVIWLATNNGITKYLGGSWEIIH